MQGDDLHRVCTMKDSNQLCYSLIDYIASGDIRRKGKRSCSLSYRGKRGVKGNKVGQGVIGALMPFCLVVSFLRHVRTSSPVRIARFAIATFLFKMDDIPSMSSII